MAQPGSSLSAQDRESGVDDGWTLVVAAAQATEQAAASDEPSTFGLSPDGQLVPGVPEDQAVLRWRSGAGWEPASHAEDSRRAILDLYLPICSATAARPITIGHVGQSLDGFIATLAGESHWITGEQNILHMHRLRALCDAVVVGAGTVALDDPQLTTRLVSGPNPLRVVIDPARRLSPDHRVFTDGAVETLYACARSLASPGERHGRAVVIGIEGTGDRIDAAELMALLRARGCSRVFVEGGGVTVSMFLEANLLDRLHIAIAPLLIGDGRPAIRFPLNLSLGDCPRPDYRVFRMGGDVLFDCDLRSSSPGRAKPDASTPVMRVI